MRNALQISLLLGLLLTSCGNDLVIGDNPPTLTYLATPQNSMFQGLGTDSVVIELAFTDVDGDLGGVNDQNIFVIDNRDNSQYIVLSFPELPSNGKAKEGTIKLTIPSSCCIYPPEAKTPPCDANPKFPDNRFTLSIYIEDLARNKSNTVTTDTIFMRCF